MFKLSLVWVISLAAMQNPVFSGKAQCVILLFI